MTTPSSRADARVAGAPKYFTGKPCKHGHVAERWTSTSICVACAQAYQAEYRPDYDASNRSKLKDYQREYYQKHRLMLIARAAAWKQANPDRAKESNRLSEKRNAEARRCITRNYRASKRTGGRHTKADVEVRLRAQKHRCAYCRKKLAAYHVDHIIPIKRGGLNTKENIQILCPPCNIRKSAKDPIDYAQSIGLLI